MKCDNRPTAKGHPRDTMTAVPWDIRHCGEEALTQPPSLESATKSSTPSETSAATAVSVATSAPSRPLPQHQRQHHHDYHSTNVFTVCQTEMQLVLLASVKSMRSLSH
ncbi:hypothetical protein C0Q70_11925 [Pomacea canaliculata]|uniref:Uncharacterized protein n=1 Tax=Pomacea canaliculata TaxID=400727 RepID=A0A2T7P7D0_POMCA|nr:hypothetical protein C0Q70_11925 [Pomacea canaliculata]